MVYLLQAYLGRDGRQEAEALLERRSGGADKPRMLGAFDEECHKLSGSLSGLNPTGGRACGPPG